MNDEAGASPRKPQSVEEEVRGECQGRIKTTWKPWIVRPNLQGNSSLGVSVAAFSEGGDQICLCQRRDYLLALAVLFILKLQKWPLI